MNKENFKKRAEETGANKCIHFDWSNDIEESCSKNDEFCSCVLLKGCKCYLV